MSKIQTEVNHFKMSILEEKLREASCLGDIEAVNILISQNVDVNCKHSINGWTPLHWACKRGQEDVVRILLDYGADISAVDNKGETPLSLCTNPVVRKLLGSSGDSMVHNSEKNPPPITPNYLSNAPINGQVDIGPRFNSRRSEYTAPAQNVTPIQNEELVLKVRVAGSSDPDFIEVEIPKWKLSYRSLLHICSEELSVKESQVERIRKLPNVRLRKDSDVKRLTDMQAIELVLTQPLNAENKHNGYQSISTCKDQTILY